MSKRHLVLAAIRGYRFDQVAPFVESLRATGYEGDTIFLDFGGLDLATRRALAASAVRLARPAPYLTDEPLHHVTLARLPAARDLLREHGASWDRVLLSDVRDVVFQADPFAAETGPALACFLEDPSHTIATQKHNARWMRQCYGDEVLKRIGGFPVSCSGTTSGATAAVLEYLELMSAELARLRARGRIDPGGDQAIHNYLLWNRRLSDAMIFANGRGNVLTLGIVPPEQVRTDPEGVSWNEDGTLPAIVHQYDRHPPLAALLTAKFPARQTPDAPLPQAAATPAPSVTPRISVVVPTFDRPDRVAALIERLSAQTASRSDFELLLVDDGSPEPVRAGPAPFHLAVLRQQNAGPGAARNLGVQHARAPLVLFLNDDAIPAPDLIEKHLQAHGNAPAPVAVMGTFPFTQAALREPFTQVLSGTDLLFDFPGLKPGELHGWTFFWTCNLSIDKAILEEAGGFDGAIFREAIVEDVELGYRLEKRGVRVLYRDDAVCEHEHPLTVDSYCRRGVRLGVNLARMWRKHGDPRILWQPAGARIGHDLFMNLQQHVEARYSESEAILEKLRRWSESARGTGEIAAADRAAVAEAVRRVSLASFFRGVLLELTGGDPARVIDHGLPRGKLTSIIACSHDALAKTKNCLESLRRTAHPDFPVEIIFTDNGSTDGSAEWLAAQPDVLLIRNGENAGAPRARNQGLARATGEYLVFLDNDIVLTPGWLQRMIWHAEVDPLCACVGACADRASHGQEIAYDGAVDFESIARFAVEQGRVHHRQARFTAALASFCLLVKRSTVDRLGGFDERFSPWGFEDDDYTARAFFAGFHSRIALDVFVHHDTYAGPRLARHLELLHRNWKVFTQKWRLGNVAYDAKVDLLAVRERGCSAEELFVPFAP